MKSFETERLILKPISVEDSDLIFDLYNSPSFIKYIGDRNIKSQTDAERYISQKFLPNMQKYGYGNFVILVKENLQKIGAVGIYNRDDLEIPDIGFSFLENFQGKGYGYEAANRLLKAAFEDFGLKKISAITTSENIASQKLIEKLGLKFQKIINFDGEELRYYETA